MASVRHQPKLQDHWQRASVMRHVVPDSPAQGPPAQGRIKECSNMFGQTGAHTLTPQDMAKKFYEVKVAY